MLISKFFKKLLSKIYKPIFKLFILFLITSWLLIGWPVIWENPRILPQIQKVNALDVVSGDGLVIYGVSGNTTPQWRIYDGTTDSFGTANNAVTGGTGLSFVIRTSPIKQEAIAGYVTSGGVLQIMCYDGTQWTNEWSVTVGGTGNDRRFDIAYETYTGDVIVLYGTNSANTNELAFRTKLGSTGCGTSNWSTATNFDPLRTSGVIQWVKMASNRRSTSTLIAAIWADANSDLSAAIWSGTAWSNEPTTALETSLEVVAAAQDVDDFDVEYESLSGDVMVVWANSAGANGTNGVRYATCTGGTANCTWSGVLTPPTWLDDATHLDISANPNTDEILFASIGNAGSDLQYGYWSGSAWTNVANADIACETPPARAKYVATGWLISGGTTRGIVIYYDSNSTSINYRLLTPPNTWTATTNFTPTPALTDGTSLQRWYQIVMDPINKDRLMLLIGDSPTELFAKRAVWNGTSLTWTNSDGGSALTASLAQLPLQAAFFDYWRSIPSPTFNESAYRFFNNLDSTDVDIPLAAQDTPATLSSSGAVFRLRMLLHVGRNKLVINGQSFKLQFSQRGADNLCDTGFSGEIYNDVTPSTVISFYDNPTPTDNSALTANANDPTHGADTVVNQTYEELNNFTNSQAAILSGQDGKWDFALKDNGAPASTTYCLRVVKADGSLLDNYSVIPQITTAAAPSLSCTLSATSTSFSSLSPSAVSTSTPDIAITITSSGGFQITVKDAGNGTNPGLYKSASPTYLIQSADTTLTAGLDGCGIQATTTASNITINPKYNKSGNNVGGLSLTDIQLASSTTAVSGAQINIKHKASASYLAPAGNYSDTITYSCSSL